jgi:hypothetical protein
MFGTSSKASAQVAVNDSGSSPLGIITAAPNYVINAISQSWQYLYSAANNFATSNHVWIYLGGPGGPSYVAYQMAGNQLVTNQLGYFNVLLFPIFDANGNQNPIPPGAQWNYAGKFPVTAVGTGATDAAAVADAKTAPKIDAGCLRWGTAGPAALGIPATDIRTTVTDYNPPWGNPIISPNTTISFGNSSVITTTYTAAVSSTTPICQVSFNSGGIVDYLPNFGVYLPPTFTMTPLS